MRSQPSNAPRHIVHGDNLMPSGSCPVAHCWQALGQSKHLSSLMHDTPAVGSLSLAADEGMLLKAMELMPASYSGTGTDQVLGAVADFLTAALTVIRPSYSAQSCGSTLCFRDTDAQTHASSNIITKQTHDPICGLSSALQTKMGFATSQA